MAMLTAKEAKERTDVKSTNDLNLILEEISKDIENAIEQGIYHVSYYNVNDNKKLIAKKHLESLGYEVNWYDNYQGFSMKILWEKI